MKQYSLGPNGGIVTSLNLFATRFDQVLKIVEKRKVCYNRAMSITVKSERKAVSILFDMNTVHNAILNDNAISSG